MILNKIPLLFSVLGIMAVLAVSGCTMPWGTTTVAPAGYGLVISDFYSSRDTVDGMGKSVSLNLEIENKGSSAILEQAYVACLMGSNFPGTTSDMMWARDYGTDQYDCNRKTGSIAAADPVRNMPGGTERISWKIKSPYLDYPLTRTDTFTARVFYKYTTKAATTIWVYNEDELTAAKQRGETIPSSLTIEKTVGPVDISLETIQPYVVTSTVGESYPIKVTVSNTGGGTLHAPVTLSTGNNAMPSISENELNLISVTITLPSGLSSDCIAALSGLELRKGASVTMPCDIIVPATSAKKSYPITFSATYGYYIESSVSIEARSKKGEVIDRIAPTITEFTVSPSSINITKEETTQINFTSNEVGNYNVKILNTTATYKTYSGSLSADIEVSLTWDGKSDAGDYLSARNYDVNLTVSDIADNTASDKKIITIQV